MSAKWKKNWGCLVSVEEMTAEAIQFLRDHVPPEGYFVGFSGGKDSIVTLELCRMAGVAHTPYYSATGIDPPEVVQFIRKYYPEVKWLRPKESFWELLKRKSPPLRTQRWCCDALKKDPAKGNTLSVRVMGIRAEESFRRASKPRVDTVKRLKQLVIKPVFYWKEWHVWEFIEKRGLPYPSLYDEGFSRIGCVICPFIFYKGSKMSGLHRSRWPKMYKTFEHAVKEWFEPIFKQGLLGKQRHDNVEDYLAAYYRGFE